MTLLEYYKRWNIQATRLGKPLTIPLKFAQRHSVPSLCHLARLVIHSNRYILIDNLAIPKTLKLFLQEYQHTI